MSIYKKLLDIQKELDPIKKNTTNPHFKNRYFDINTLLEEVKPVLSKHEVVLLQPLEVIEGKMCLTTILHDTEDGTEVKGSMDFPDTLTDPQKIGGAITYFRRYSLQSMLGLEAEDDDGNIASSKPSHPSTHASLICPECDSHSVKVIPAGTSKEGKAYNAFNSCQDCKHTFR